MHIMQRIEFANRDYYATLPEGFSIDNEPPETKIAVEKCRALEEELAKRFEPMLSQYHDGLITASELLSRMMLEAYREADGINIAKIKAL